MDIFRTVVPYAASAFAIAVGLASVTAPPLFSLARDLAVALIIGGFAGLGVSVAVPTMIRTSTRRARTAGYLEGAADAAIKRLTAEKPAKRRVR